MSSQLFRDHQYLIFEAIAQQDNQVEKPEYDDFKLRYFSGQSLGEAGLIDGDFSQPDNDYPSVSRLSNTMGEWMAVAEKPAPNGTEFIVFADAYGYCPIFYAHLDSTRLVVSDSFHGVASAMERARTPRTINLANYVSSLTSRHSQFQGMYSDETMVNEIKIMRPDVFLHIGGSGGVDFVDRAELNTKIGSLDYDSLVRSGIELSSTIFGLFSGMESVDRRITLSGGIDSRVALALLMASDQHRNYKIFSVDPRSWHNENTVHVIERDIELADLMRRDLGLEWWHPGDRSAIETDFHESLEAYQSHRSNLQYLFRPSTSLTFHDRPTVTLRGGGGETISATSGARKLSTRFIESNSGKAPSSWIAEHLMKSAEIVPEAKADVREFLKSTYRASEGATLQESLDNHYFQSRNRSHFGHMRYSRTSNELAIHVLSNPYLLAASKLISFEDRARGALVRDIFRGSTPQLLQYAFASEDRTDYLREGSQPPKDTTSRKWVSSYDETKLRSGKIHYLSGREANSRVANTLAASEVAATNYLKFIFRLIEDLASSSQRDVLAKQHALTMGSISRGRINVYHSIAKARSVVDGFIPQPALGAIVVLQCTDVQKERHSEITLVEPNRMAAANQRNRKMPLFQQVPTLELDDDGFHIESNFVGDSNSSVEFAYYLLKDNVRVALRWYEPEQRVTFEDSYGPGLYQGVAHIRFEGKSEPAVYERTNTIEI